MRKRKKSKINIFDPPIGWVYVISNKAMPGLLKVGFTTKQPEQRAYELYNTGAPYPYQVEYSLKVKRPFRVEQDVHKKLSQFHASKEWFTCDLIVAKEAIELCSLNKYQAKDKTISIEKELDAHLRYILSLANNSNMEIESTYSEEALTKYEHDLNDEIITDNKPSDNQTQESQPEEPTIKHKKAYPYKVIVACKGCGQKLRVDGGKHLKIRCPKCNATFIKYTF